LIRPDERDTLDGGNCNDFALGHDRSKGGIDASTAAFDREIYEPANGFIYDESSGMSACTAVRFALHGIRPILRW
jgi:hypothetical protein